MMPFSPFPKAAVPGLIGTNEVAKNGVVVANDRDSRAIIAGDDVAGAGRRAANRAVRRNQDDSVAQVTEVVGTGDIGANQVALNEMAALAV